MTVKPAALAQRAILGLILVLLGLVAFSGTADATTVDVTVVAARPGAAAPAGDVATDPTILKGTVCTADVGQSSSGFLPVNRWADATTGFHSRLDADAWNDVSEKIQRDGFASAWMQIGNAAWSLSTNLLHASTSFCPIKTLGYPMDQIVSVIGGAVTTSGLLMAILSWMICSTLWRLYKGNSAAWVIKEFVKTGAVLAVMFAMVAGARSSTADAPGRTSPWWWVAQTNSAVNTLSGALSSAVLDGADGIALGYQKLSDSSGLVAGEWTLHCAALDGQQTQTYVDYLHDEYKTSWTNPDSGAVTAGSSLPETVSSLWEAATLPVWAGTQFGTSNPYADQVFCFALEARSLGASADKSTFVSYLVKSLGITRDEAKKIVADSHAMDIDSTTARDNAWAGWAECAPADATTANSRTGWDGLADRAADGSDDKNGTNSACAKWWTGSGDISRSNLNWEDDEDAIASATGPDHEAEENYLDSLHGKGGSSTGVATVLYAIGSIINAGVFVLIAAMQGLSKIILVFMVAGIFAALVRSLAPGDDAALFKQSAKQLLGASFVSSCAGLLISVILLIAAVITGAAVTMFGPGTTGAITAASLGPAMGAWFVHWLFSSVLSLPSPFTVKGMAAWGRGITSGVIGGAVGAGLVSAAGRVTGRGGRLGGRAARRIWDRTHPRVTGNRPQRGINATDKGESATLQANRAARADKAEVARADVEAKKTRAARAAEERSGRVKEPRTHTKGRHSDTPRTYRTLSDRAADAADRIKDGFHRSADRVKDGLGRYKALTTPKRRGTRAHRAPLNTKAGLRAAAAETRAAVTGVRDKASRALAERREHPYTAPVVAASRAIDRAKQAAGRVQRAAPAIRRTAGVLAIGAVGGAPLAAGAAAVMAGRSFAGRVRAYRADRAAANPDDAASPAPSQPAEDPSRSPATPATPPRRAVRAVRAGSAWTGAARRVPVRSYGPRTIGRVQARRASYRATGSATRQAGR